MSSPVRALSLLCARPLHRDGDLQGLHGTATTQTCDGSRVARIKPGGKAHISFRRADPVRHVEANPTQPFHPRLGPGVVCLRVRALLQDEVTRDVTRRDSKTTCGGNEDVCVILAYALAIGERLGCARVRIGNAGHVFDAVAYNADQLVKSAELVLAAYRAGEIMDCAVGPSLSRLAQINPLRNTIGKPADDAIAILGLDSAHRFDHHLLVRTADRDEMDGISEPVLELQRLIATGNAHAPTGRAMAPVGG